MLKNITFSVEGNLIDKARKKAAKDHVSLNLLFRTWVQNYVQTENAGKRYDSLMRKMSGAVAGKTFSRDDMNER